LTLASHSLNGFGNELIFGLRVVSLIAHTDYHIVFATIFAESFVLLERFLLKMIAVTALEIFVFVVFQLNIGRFPSLNLYSHQRFGVILCLSL